MNYLDACYTAMVLVGRLKWMDSFLCDRQQRVVVNGVKSDCAPVFVRCPQGTILGPLLFSLYINDIINKTDSELRFLLTTAFATVKSKIVKTRLNFRRI